MSSFSFSRLFTSDNNTPRHRVQEVSSSFDEVDKMELDVIDPLDWSVDQVVAFLCHTPSTWSSLRPDPIKFEVALKKQRVNGNVLPSLLLKGVNEEILRKDLGLEAFGDRFVVLEVIRHLQQRSVKYRSITQELRSIRYE
jgi:hypothetical protein